MITEVLGFRSALRVTSAGAGLHHRTKLSIKQTKPGQFHTSSHSKKGRTKPNVEGKQTACDQFNCCVQVCSSQSLDAVPNHSSELGIAIMDTLLSYSSPSKRSCRPIARRSNTRYYRLRAPLISIPPTIPAATATPPMMATPTKPSLDTLSSISCCRLLACRFPGSFSSSNSLYRLASA